MQKSMLSFRLISRLIGCAVALSCHLPSRAADQEGTETLLKGKAVTESNVLNALTPAAGNGDVDVSGQTRSLRIGAPGAQNSIPAAPRPKASAALLITFETNSATLQPRSKEQLDVVAAALKNERLKEYRFEVDGHADPRGAADANRSLSQLRAESVRNYLIATHGIPDSRLRAVGKGDSEPMNTRDPSAPENRRVTITTVTP